MLVRTKGTKEIKSSFRLIFHFSFLFPKQIELFIFEMLPKCSYFKSSETTVVLLKLSS